MTHLPFSAFSQTLSLSQSIKTQAPSFFNANPDALAGQNIPRSPVPLGSPIVTPSILPSGATPPASPVAVISPDAKCVADEPVGLLDASSPWSSASQSFSSAISSAAASGSQTTDPKASVDADAAEVLANFFSFHQAGKR
jgi:hypothetical protein